jgi:hypothetical protein
MMNEQLGHQTWFDSNGDANYFDIQSKYWDLIFDNQNIGWETGAA